MAKRTRTSTNTNNNQAPKESTMAKHPKTSTSTNTNDQESTMIDNSPVSKESEVTSTTTSTNNNSSQAPNERNNKKEHNTVSNDMSSIPEHYREFFLNTTAGLIILLMVGLLVWYVSPILGDLFALFLLIVVVPITIIIGGISSGYFGINAVLVLVGADTMDVRDLFSKRFFWTPADEE